jgi:hypothetical protein
MALSEIQVVGDEFEFTVSVPLAEVGGKDAPAGAILGHAHQQLVQQMTEESQIESADAQIAKLQAMKSKGGAVVNRK